MGVVVPVPCMVLGGQVRGSVLRVGVLHPPSVKLYRSSLSTSPPGCRGEESGKKGVESGKKAAFTSRPLSVSAA